MISKITKKIYNSQDNKTLSSTAYLIVFALIFVLNHLVLLYSDDFRYFFIFPGKERVAGITDVFVSQFNHWFQHGGRVPAHVFAQLFLWLDSDILFDLFNTLFFVLLIRNILALSNEGRKTGWISVLAAAALYWLFNPSFGQTTLWLTGSCNYLWMPVLELSAFYVFGHPMKENVFVTVLQYLLFFAAGWGNENMSLTVIAGCFLLLMQSGNNGSPYFRKQLSWFLTMLLGYLFLLAAPGNYERVGGTGNFFANLLEILPARLAMCMNMFVSNYFYLFLLVLAFSVIYYFANIDENPLKNATLKKTAFYGGLALFCNFVMLASPYYPERASVGTLIFLIISFLCVSGRFLAKMDSFAFPFILLLSIVFSISFVFHSWIILQQYRYESDLIRQLINAKTSGETDIVIHSDLHPESSKYCINYDLVYSLSDDADYWVNQYCSEYYEISSLSVLHGK